MVDSVEYCLEAWFRSMVDSVEYSWLIGVLFRKRGVWLIPWSIV